MVDTYGEPQEATPSTLTWFDVGPWQRLVASKVYHDHEFPIPHIDSVASHIDLPGAAGQGHGPWRGSTAG